MSTVPAVVAYDETWPAWFAEVRAELDPLLAAWAVEPVEHIGSTAIPGMPAKPLLDVLVTVADPTAAGQAADVLATTVVGWERRPHRVDAELVVHVVAGIDRVNLQITVPDSDLRRERLAFRDALRADPVLVAEYAELKRRLVACNGGRGYDAADKRDFVRTVLSGVGVRLRDDLHVPHRDPR